MKLYVIRHAQTDGNLKNIMIGKSDIPINSIGIEQATKAIEVVKNLDYDFIICSPMLRTKQTCAIVNSKHNKEVIFDNRIVEMNFGTIENKSIDEIDTNYWNYYSDLKYPLSITMKDHCHNIWHFLDDIKEKYQDKKILIVTHNEVCRAINAYFNGIPSDGNMWPLGHKNCEVREYNA